MWGRGLEMILEGRDPNVQQQGSLHQQKELYLG
jgi:hypothetical protein